MDLAGLYWNDRHKKTRISAGFRSFWDEPELGFGTSGRTRTDTILRSPDFESGASTNSATLAMCGAHSNDLTALVKHLFRKIPFIFTWVTGIERFGEKAAGVSIL